MREILFRGKDVKEHWHTGLLAHVGNAWYISNGAGIPTAYEVMPSTIGQYTGLKDVNGTKIFEGDIVKRFWFGKMCIYQINYDKGLASFIGLRGIGYTTFDYDSFEFEIIGNVYDNPELLKEREQA